MGQKRPLMCDAAAMPRIRVISALGADDSAVTDYAPRDGYLPRPRPQCRHCTVLERVLTRPRIDFRWFSSTPIVALIVYDGGVRVRPCRVA